MDSIHNPDRFMADLRQILSQGRKRIGLLIGAGAPLSVRVNEAGQLNQDGKPLILGVDDLTNLVISKLDGLHAVAAGKIRESLKDGGNIESILSRVRLLENAIGETPVHGLDSNGYAQMGARLCKAIGEAVSATLPFERTAYHELVAWVGGTLTCPIFCTRRNESLLHE